ncbi:MAG: hypothetical protein M1814_000893 [Vezdaea aestivalis]|nr:MAG: hypothetical protein M1814_000893 [Vezdaea aestivalis]
MRDQEECQVERIWSNPARTTVFAQASSSGLAPIFSFRRVNVARKDPLPSNPTSVASRVLESYDHVSEKGKEAWYSGREEMGREIRQIIHDIWPACFKDPLISRPSTVVDVDSDESEQIHWMTYRHSLYSRYIEYLDMHGHLEPTRDKIKCLEITNLPKHQQLGGKAFCPSTVIKTPDGQQFVWKGINFQIFLQYCVGSADLNEDHQIKLMIQEMSRSILTLVNMPPHPRIQPPPTYYTLIDDPDYPIIEPVICGTLYPYFPKEDMYPRIRASKAKGELLPLELIAKWFAEMAAAVKHTHLVAHTYHMDVKPGNFLVDDNDDLVLIDWMQGDCTARILAPEADGTWDVEEITAPKESQDRTILKYTKYEGPARSNQDPALDWGRTWNKWKVFPIWEKECPLALELAEVFSLGRTMWMLLRWPEDAVLESVKHPLELITNWEQDGKDGIPENWKEFVDQCMALDPNERPGVVTVAEFWEEVATVSLVSQMKLA